VQIAALVISSTKSSQLRRIPRSKVSWFERSQVQKNSSSTIHDEQETVFLLPQLKQMAHQASSQHDNHHSDNYHDKHAQSRVNPQSPVDQFVGSALPVFLLILGGMRSLIMFSVPIILLLQCRPVGALSTEERSISGEAALAVTLLAFAPLIGEVIYTLYTNIKAKFKKPEREWYEEEIVEPPWSFWNTFTKLSESFKLYRQKKINETPSKPKIKHSTNSKRRAQYARAADRLDAANKSLVARTASALLGFLSSNFSYWGPEIKLIESTVLYLPKKLAIFCRSLEVRAYLAPTMVYNRLYWFYYDIYYWVSESLWFARDNLELLLLDCKIYFTDALALARQNLKRRVYYYYAWCTYYYRNLTSRIRYNFSLLAWYARRLAIWLYFAPTQARLYSILILQIVYLNVIQSTSLPEYVYYVLDALERIGDYYGKLYENLKNQRYPVPSLYKLAWGCTLLLHDRMIRCWQICIQLKSSAATIFQRWYAFFCTLFHRDLNAQSPQALYRPAWTSLVPAWVSPAPASVSPAQA
jgi:hypothetical protein